MIITVITNIVYTAKNFAMAKAGSIGEYQVHVTGYYLRGHPQNTSRPGRWWCPGKRYGALRGVGVVLAIVTFVNKKNSLSV